MRRYAWLFGLLILAGVGTYASFSLMYVADHAISRVPRNEVGTLGYLFEKILGVDAVNFDTSTGLVVNTSRLGGRTRYEYLKAGSPTCGVGEAWTAIDTSGVAICSSVGAPSTLAMIGTVGEFTGSVAVYRANVALPIAMTSGMDIMDGDIIQTPLSGSAEIIFIDDSVIRLSSDTTLSLNIGSNLGEGQIAQIILQNGNLWGRILTQTGVYDIGTDDIVAAVRGTSLALTKTGVSVPKVSFKYNTPTSSGWTYTRSNLVVSPKTVLTVVDSSLSIGSGVVKIDCLRDSTSITMNTEQRFTTDGKCNGLIPTPTTAATLYTSTDDWVKKNTVKDLEYMSNLLYVSGSIGPDNTPTTNLANTLTGGIEKQNKILAEYQSSAPKPGAEAASLCQNGEEWRGDKYGCQPIGLIAIADYSRGDLNLYFLSGAIPPVGASSSGRLIQGVNPSQNGYYIFNNGQYISYSTPSINAALNQYKRGLELKYVKIRMDVVLPFRNGPPGQSDRFILNPTARGGDFLKVDGTNKYSTGGNVTLNDLTPTSIEYNSSAPDPTGSLFVGNKNAAILTQPIKNTIRFIKIIEMPEE